MKKSAHIQEVFHTDWSHLKAEQAAALLSAQNQLIQSRTSEDFEEQGRLHYLVSGIICKDHKVFKGLTAEQINDVFADINIFNKIWTHFHVTWYKKGKKRYISPEDRMTDLVFEQLVDADSEYSNFLVESQTSEKEAEKHLNRLISILYRPEIEGKKQPYYAKQAKSDADKLPKALKFQYKYLILRTYANVRGQIMQTFDDLFPSGSGSEEYKPVRLGRMWHDILVDLAELNQYRGIDEAKKAPIYEALYILNKKAREARELRDKMKNNATRS